jgi:hypothetical protein
MAPPCNAAPARVDVTDFATDIDISLVGPLPMPF